MEKQKNHSDSLFRKRLRKFKKLKRGYYSFLLLLSLYVTSFFLPLLMNSVALAVRYQDEWYFPIWKFYPRDDFDLKGLAEVDYRNLERTFAKRKYAHKEGKLIEQEGFFPKKKDRNSIKWEPIEDWITGYRIHVPMALRSDQFGQYSEAALFMEEAKNDLARAKEKLFSLSRKEVSSSQIDENKKTGQKKFLAENWNLVQEVVRTWPEKDTLKALLPILERITPEVVSLKKEIVSYQARRQSLSEEEEDYYTKLYRLFQVLRNLRKNISFLQDSKDNFLKEKEEGVIFLSYWNEDINPVDVNPNWQPDVKRRKHEDGVGFDLKCHYLDDAKTIAVIDGLLWRRSRPFEALHLKNYYDLAPAIVAAEKKLPLENNIVIMPFYPHDYRENFLAVNEYPSDRHWLGTDEAGRDIFVRMAYGFNISISFSVIVLFFSYFIGIWVGALLGYFGSLLDLIGLRFVEIWSAIPFLYAVIILSALVLPESHPDLPLLMQPSLWLLTFILSSFGWMGISYYIRGEFFREKAKDYVSAALSIGSSNNTIIFKHILPNALTSIISFAPFAVVGNILSLVSLDFLGFGLPSPTPSWGELLSQGVKPENGWHMIASPIGFMFITLMTVVFIGEAIREAFDPKVHSRLR